MHLHCGLNLPAAPTQLLQNGATAETLNDYLQLQAGIVSEGLHDADEQCCTCQTLNDFLHLQAGFVIEGMEGFGPLKACAAVRLHGRG
jgi:hypothetical protein